MSDSAANRTHRAARRRAERDERKQDQVPGVKSDRGWRDHGKLLEVLCHSRRVCRVSRQMKAW